MQVFKALGVGVASKIMVHAMNREKSQEVAYGS